MHYVFDSDVHIHVLTIVIHVYQLTCTINVDKCMNLKMFLIDPANISVAYHSPWEFKLGTAGNEFIISVIIESKRVSVRASYTFSIIKHVKQSAGKVKGFTSCKRATAYDGGQ